MVAKRVLKRVANSAVKSFLSKAASRVLAGAAGGSVIPGLGTAAGATGGAVVGIGTAIVIDGLLLEAEEALNRDGFRRELVTVLREARREFEDQMLGTTNTPK